jgi:hypothetical protein
MGKPGLIRKLQTMGWNKGMYSTEGHARGRRRPNRANGTTVWREDRRKALILTEHLFCARPPTSGMSCDYTDNLVTMFATLLCRWGKRRWGRLHLDWPSVEGQVHPIRKPLVTLPGVTISRWRVKQFKLYPDMAEWLSAVETASELHLREKLTRQSLQEEELGGFL